MALIVGAMLVSASGAATTKAQKGAKIDVSTRAAVIHYLRSIHVNPKHAVIQRGLRNYAGAHCPGKGWTCASTRHTVVQIAKRGGQNRFACATAKCAVVQIGSATRGLKASSRGSKSKPPPSGNTASCIKTTGVTQDCTINQPSATGTNTAIVYMVNTKLTGLTQNANYTASITQGPASATGSSNINVACVQQALGITGSTTTKSGSVTVTSDAHQSVTVQQNSLTGSNTVQGATQNGCASPTSSLTQDEELNSIVTATGSITQNQDTFVGSPNVPNVLLDIEQNQNAAGGFKNNAFATATNSASFVQTSNMTAVANTPKGPVVQTQSSPDDTPPFSGIVAAINQDTTGVSNASATQIETQCQDAVDTSQGPAQTTCDKNDADKPSYSVIQTQYGPEGIYHSTGAAQGRTPFAHKTPGDSAQTGNPGNPHNVWGVTQSSTQDNDTNSGQKNTIAGGITSSGSGTTNQNALIQGSNTIDVQDGSSTILCPTGMGSCTKTLSKPKITGQPDNPSFDGSGQPFTFQNADPTVTFYCKIDTNAYLPCTHVDNPSTSAGPPYSPATGYQTTSTLAPGTHTFSVATVDPANSNTLGPATATISWTILPISVFALGTDGSSAGWECQPGGPIKLQVGTDPGTFAGISIDNAGGTAFDSMPPEGPSFTADNYQAGSPRFVIDLSNDHQLIGYPGISGLNGTDMAWSDSAMEGGNNTYRPWSDVRTFETGTGTTVSDAFVVADASQWIQQTVPNFGPDNISDLTFNGVDFNSATCSS